MENNSTESRSPLPSKTRLALSGRGFRATLIHLGTPWQLNEMAALNKVSAFTPAPWKPEGTEHSAKKRPIPSEWETFKEGNKL